MWIDRDQMSGNLNDAMAEAVENAAVVVMCMSQYYKESTNCKRGKYHFQNHCKHFGFIKVN